MGEKIVRKVATCAEAGGVHHCDVLVVNPCWQELAEECPRLGSFWDHCRGLGPEELPHYGLLRSILVSFFFPRCALVLPMIFVPGGFYLCLPAPFFFATASTS